MNPILKWAIVGAALAFVQNFIFNGTHQSDWTDRGATGFVGIIVWAAVGAVIGLVISLSTAKKSKKSKED